MKRSDFFKSVMAPGLACGCAFGLGVNNVFCSGMGGSKGDIRPEETPCNEKIEFTQNWVKRFFSIVDEQLDEGTRNKLMRLNGIACAKGAYGGIAGSEKESTLEEIDQKILQWQKNMGSENIYRKDDKIFFNYVGNPKGLKIADGYCLCPMIEDKPEVLSATYCQCSVGYVSYMFQKFITFRPVNVELLESLRSGGKACRFRVTI